MGLTRIDAHLMLHVIVSERVFEYRILGLGFMPAFLLVAALIKNHD